MPPPDPRRFIDYLAANLRRLRVREALSQAAFSERAGFDVRFIQRVERGVVNVSIETLARLSDTLGVRPAVLLRPAVRKAGKPGRPPASRASRSPKGTLR